MVNIHTAPGNRNQHRKLKRKLFFAIVILLINNVNVRREMRKDNKIVRETVKLNPSSTNHSL
jgi:hypothetical protein